MTLLEFCEYIESNADHIQVFETVDGKWGSYKLSELPPKLAIQTVMRFVKDRKIPGMVQHDGRLSR